MVADGKEIMKSIFGLICRSLVRACRCAADLLKVKQHEKVICLHGNVDRNRAPIGLDPAYPFSIDQDPRMAADLADFGMIRFHCIPQFLKRTSCGRFNFSAYSAMLAKPSNPHTTSAHSHIRIARIYDGGLPQGVLCT